MSIKAASVNVKVVKPSNTEELQWHFAFDRRSRCFDPSSAAEGFHPPLVFLANRLTYLGEFCTRASQRTSQYPLPYSTHTCTMNRRTRLGESQSEGLAHHHNHHKFEEPQEIVIVGGGISGLATALALHRVGLKSLVLEAAESLRITGAALTLWDNAWRALDALGIGDTIRQKHTQLQRIETFSLSTGLTKIVQLKGENGERDREVRSVKRRDLLEALLDALPPQTIRFASRIVAIKERKTSPIATMLELDDGTHISAKVVIGCDGVHSVVAEWLGLGSLQLSGRSAYLGLATFPEGHQFEPKALQIWGKGMRAGFVPCNTTDVFWFVARNSVDRDAEICHDQERLRQEALDELKNFPDESIVEIVRRTQAGTLSLATLRYRLLWPFMGKRAWKGTVTVAGDAMHPMTPELGQGGCSALEDAVALGRCLGEAMKKCAVGSEEEEEEVRIEMALEKYVEGRKWRAFGLTVGSYISGILQTGTSSFIRFIRDKFLFNMLSPRMLRHTDYDCGILPKVS